MSKSTFNLIGRMILLVALGLGLLLSAPLAQTALAGGPGLPAVQGEQATPTSEPTYLRPLLVIEYFTLGSDNVSPSSSYDLSIRIVNTGQKTAQNVVASFAVGDFIPRGTGGVVAVGEVHPNNRFDFVQPLTASSDLAGKGIATLVMTLSYTAENGTTYTENFTLTFGVNNPRYVASTNTPTPTPTATAGPSLRPQLVISGYKTDVEVLQPGAMFTLSLDIMNVGNAPAKRITMILGGGSTHGTDSGGTPEPGGTSGAGGEFTNFAPIGSSNIQSLGDIDIEDSVSANQSLIVNVSTNPGAYPMKISFAYTDDRGRTLTDDQVITLLVYSLPQVNIDFYQPPGEFYAGQPGMLPLQVVNTGRKSVVLGNLRVSAEGADLMNNVILIGNLDSGGYFPLDASVIPMQPGPLDLLLTLDYTDDFNQAQQIQRTITIDVFEAPIFEPPTDGSLGPDGSGVPMPVEPETFSQKLVRFLRGLFGLGSDQVQPTDGGMPIEGMPGEDGMPVEGGGGGGAPLKGP